MMNAGPSPADTETISISIGLGSDGRSSSIVLPRGHDLVKHLERLLPPTASSTPSPQPLLAQTPEAARFDAVRALSALQQQPSPIVSPALAPASLSQYVHAHSRYETSTPAPMSAPLSPLYDSPRGGVRVYHHTQEYLQHGSEPRATRTRRRRGTAGSGGKRCQVVGCDKISVSRGLCRGHGGGRRCQHEGCTKGAQSRSNFCWAHGGGQRCEVKGCMRSRKSKRFCVAHLQWEDAAPVAESAVRGRPLYESFPRPVVELPTPIMPKAESVGGASPTALTGSPRLPSLLQALRNTQQTSMVAQH